MRQFIDKLIHQEWKKYITKKNLIIAALVFVIVILLGIICLKKTDSEVKTYHSDGGVTRINFSNGEIQSIEKIK